MKDKRTSQKNKRHKVKAKGQETIENTWPVSRVLILNGPVSNLNGQAVYLVRGFPTGT